RNRIGTDDQRGRSLLRNDREVRGDLTLRLAEPLDGYRVGVLHGDETEPRQGPSLTRWQQGSRSGSRAGSTQGQHADLSASVRGAQRAGCSSRSLGGRVPLSKSPVSYASTTACTRSRRSSFWRMCVMCVLTVVSLM